MKKKINKKRPGFTLVEMVIVITILGVISGLGFMKFGQVQQNAKINADKVAASSLATATSLAIQDNLSDIIGESGEVDKEKLKPEYISSIPIPQSIVLGDDSNKINDFTIIVSNDDEISVNVGNKQFYPIED